MPPKFVICSNFQTFSSVQSKSFISIFNYCGLTNTSKLKIEDLSRENQSIIFERVYPLKIFYPLIFNLEIK